MRLKGQVGRWVAPSRGGYAATIAPVNRGASSRTVRETVPVPPQAPASATLAVQRRDTDGPAAER